MAQNTSIQWTDHTWNIARGCTKVDEDCKFCYMYRDSMNSTRYNPLQIERTKTVFNMPLKLKEPSKIFTCSLTDFFLPEIDPYRAEAWDIIRRCPQHTFQILTKRPERIFESLPEDWDCNEGWSNVWLGTSCGSQKSEQRIIDLVHSTFAKVKFLSLEPLHGPIDLSSITKYYPAVKESFYVLPAIDWVIVGGESGNENGKYRYRPCELEWIEKIIEDCQRNNIPVFVKQLGTHLAKKMKLSDRHGGNIDEFPSHLQIRQFPTTH
jgi:protein gp37